MNDQKNSGGMFQTAGVARSVWVYLPATILYRGISFVRGLVLAWLLAKHEGQYGLLNIALQTINILAPLASLGLSDAVTRYTPAYLAKRRLIAFLSFVWRLTVGLTVAVTLALLVLSGPIGQAIFAVEGVSPADVLPLTRATFAAIIAIVVYFLIIAVMKGLRMFPALAFMELFHGVLFFVLTVLGLAYIGPKASYVVWAYVIALIIPAGLWAIGMYRKLPNDKTGQDPLDRGPLARQLMVFGFWASAAGVLWQTWQIYSLWHLAKFASARLGDTFSASRLLGQLVLILAAALAAVVTTAVCTLWEKGDRDRADFLLDLYSKAVLLALLVASVILTACRHWLAQIFPSQFADVAHILPETFLFFQFLSVLNFLAIRFVLMEKMHLMLWAWLAGLVTNVLLALVLIRSGWALEGAAHAAAWSAVPAILVTLAFIRLRHRPVSPGLLVLVAAPLVLLTPAWLAVPAVLILAAWAAITNHIFSDRQRAAIIERLLQSRG